MTACDETSAPKASPPKAWSERLKKNLMEMSICADQIKHSVEAKDWVDVELNFVKLNKLVKVVRWLQGDETPKVYIEVLVILENLMLSDPPLAKEGCEKNKKKSDTNATALNSVIQLLEDNIKEHVDLVADYRENPESESESESEEDELEEEISDSDFSSTWSSEDEDEDGSKYQEPEGESWKKKIANIRDYFEKLPRITRGKVEKKFIAIRFRKGKGNLEMIAQLKVLKEFARSPAQYIKILRVIIERQLTFLPCGHMPVCVWKECAHNMLLILNVLEKYDVLAYGFADKTKDRNLFSLYPQICTEFYMSLKSIHPKTKAYKEMLGGIPILFALSQKALAYLLNRRRMKAAVKVAFTLVQLVYCMTQDEYDAMLKHEEYTQCEINQAAEVHPWPTAFVSEHVHQPPTFPKTCKALMEEMLTLIDEYGNGERKTLAMFYGIYHHAVNDEFSKSRDLLLTSHLQDEVQRMDASTKINFNRAMAQLGLCAYRAGHIAEAHRHLSVLYADGNVKELLHQGVSDSGLCAKTRKQVIMEERRLIPYHMRINLELLEAVHLICVVLLRVPNMLAKTRAKRTVISKSYQKKNVLKRTFKQLLASREQAFKRPSVYLWKCIMAATGDLGKGDFQKSFGVIKSFLEDHDHLKRIENTGGMRSKRQRSEGQCSEMPS